MTELSVDPLCYGVVVVKATHTETSIHQGCSLSPQEQGHCHFQEVASWMRIDDIGLSIMTANGKHKRITCVLCDEVASANSKKF